MDQTKIQPVSGTSRHESKNANVSFDGFQIHSDVCKNIHLTGKILEWSETNWEGLNISIIVHGDSKR